MSFPNFAGKHAHDAFFTPRDFAAYLRRIGHVPEDLAMPRGIIFAYHARHMARILASEATQRVTYLPGNFTMVGATDGDATDGDATGGDATDSGELGGAVGVCSGFGIGAPAVVNLLELFIALGTRRFVSIGTAGALQRTLAIGDVVVCDRAIRDEGVSHHYLPAERYAHAAPTLAAALATALSQSGPAPTIGASWTIDAPYRETVAEARHYQQEGVLTIEMEAAALFAVAQLRGAELAAGFVISDSLADLVWNPQFESETVAVGYERLFRAARASLLDAQA